jgi:mannose-6-phosphate isomerase-like protein (cupin superfamily)
MAKTGDTIHNPHNGETATFLTTSADSNGQLLRMAFKIEAGNGLNIPPHMHPKQVQRFEITGGRMKMLLDGVETYHESGDKITVPIGIYYKWSQVGDKPLEFIVEYEPAGQWENFFETSFAYANAKHNGKKVNLFLASSVLLSTYPDQMVIAGPPLPVQKLIFKVFGWIGRRLGYQPFPPKS